MKILYLDLNEPGDQFQTFRYPAGEWQVRLTEAGYKSVCEADEVRVCAQLRSGDDLYRLALLIDAVSHSGEEPPPIEVAIPYLFASRADRRFIPGDCDGSTVVLRMLSAQRTRQLGFRTLDCHNPRTAANWDIIDISPKQFILKTITSVSIRENLVPTRKLALVFPDEGAAGRYDIPTWVGNNQYAVETVKYFGAKDRDPLTGVVRGLKLPPINEQTVLVVDDICDGGRTFEEVAKCLPGHHLYLYVTHGIFSKGLTGLLQSYKHIFTTDSIYNLESEHVSVFNTSEMIWR